ncbi:MAG: hypothetical protein KKB46_04505 [Candidatus Omnitrophica bacterium]|nr:hypothetical protein [Candidatus Omnitrophota bacterium]
MRVFIILMFLCLFMASSLIADEEISVSEPYLNVYYFRSNFRCSNCYKIEEYIKEAVEKYFQDKLVSGRIVYRVINIDEKENAHFVDDYQLYTKSVVLSKLENGIEIEYKNLQKIWAYLNDKEKFHNYIKEEVYNFFNEAKEINQ